MLHKSSFFFTVEETSATAWERCPETAGKSVSSETHRTYCYVNVRNAHGDLCYSDSVWQLCCYLCSLSLPLVNIHFLG